MFPIHPSLLAELAPRTFLPLSDVTTGSSAAADKRLSCVQMYTMSVDERKPLTAIPGQIIIPSLWAQISPL
uniref:Uncharacterized protein n=1 Tax=Ascaris lumbricoides TaxID=6252 RepID=A0A0M3IC75_ASCLU